MCIVVRIPMVIVMRGMAFQPHGLIDSISGLYLPSFCLFGLVKGHVMCEGEIQ